MLTSTDFAHGIIRKLEVINFFLHSCNMYWLKIRVKGTVQGPRENEHLKASFLENCYSTSVHRRKELNESCISSFFLKNCSLYFAGKFNIIGIYPSF